MTREDALAHEIDAGPRSLWSRRKIMSVGAAAGAGALTTGLAGCSDNGSDASDDKVKKAIENPSDNLNRKGFPIVDESITLHFMTARGVNQAKNYNKVANWKKYQSKTNVTIDWGLVPKEGLEEKRNLALSSGDYPGAFHSCQFDALDVGKYGSQGVFIKVNTLIDKYMPNLAQLIKDNPDIRRGMTFPDGGRYGMPLIFDPKFAGLRIHYKPWVRSDWLDKVDMEPPSTTEDYFQYLKAVKRKSSDTRTVPYAESGNLNFLRQALMGSFAVSNRGTTQSYLDADPDDDTKVRFFPITDGYKALLEYLHRLYSAGLIAKNIFSMDSAKFQNAAAKGNYASMVAISPDDNYQAKHFVPTSALKGPDGQQTYNNIGSPLQGVGNFVITDKSKHPVETARWLDYFYSDEGAKLFFLGVEGVSYKKTQNGYQFVDKITNNPKGLNLNQALKPYVTYVAGGYPGIVKEDYFQGTESSKQSTRGAKKLETYEQKKIWPNFTFTQTETERLDGLADDIEKYVDESWPKFVTGQMPLSNWRKYVEKIKKMGLDDYMELQQTAYDRYRKA